jgi:NADH:ubiquinone oxidoreductase subunit 6 (subunit J)
VGSDFGSPRLLGELLFTKYLLPFELTSVLLLVAIIGAIILAKKRI